MQWKSSIHSILLLLSHLWDATVLSWKSEKSVVKVSKIHWLLHWSVKHVYSADGRSKNLGGETKLIWNNFVIIMVPRCWKYVCHVSKICPFYWKNGNNLLKSKSTQICIRIMISIFLCNLIIEMSLIFLHLKHNLVIFRLRFLNLVHYGGRGIKK